MITFNELNYVNSRPSNCPYPGIVYDKDLAEELKYSDGKDSIIIYCTKENKRIALPQSRNIRITPDILASLRAQYGIKNVETT